MSAPELFLVSGGSGGIGAATCDALAAEGFIPVVGYHREQSSAISVARRTGGLTLALDLTCDASIDHALSQLSGQDFTLAGAVIAASPPPVLAPFGQITPADLQSQWQVNVVGPQRLLAGLVKQRWRPRKEGVVVGVLSHAMGGDSHPAASNLGAYVVAKHGLSGLLAVLAADYPWLRVRSVKPGFTETRMLSAYDDRFLELQREKMPFQTPQEVAQQIVAEVLSS